jgi:hypothetical protein
VLAVLSSIWIPSGRPHCRPSRTDCLTAIGTAAGALGSFITAGIALVRRGNLGSRTSGRRSSTTSLLVVMVKRPFLENSWD